MKHQTKWQRQKRKAPIISHSHFPNYRTHKAIGSVHKRRLILCKLNAVGGEDGERGIVVTEDGGVDTKHRDMNTNEGAKSIFEGMELSVLLLVPIAWGTWSPAIVLLYRQLGTHPVPPPLLNSYFQLVPFSALCLALIARQSNFSKHQRE